MAAVLIPLLPVILWPSGGKTWRLPAPRFPMYAVFLATRVDSEVVSFIEDNRAELKDIPGPNCCFVYFRDRDEAAFLRPWRYSEHERFVVPVAKLLGVPLKELPCIVFFRKFTACKYWRRELRGVPCNELMFKVRDVFSDVQWDDANPFKRHDRIVFWEKQAVMIKATAQTLAPQLFTELAKKAMIGPH